MADARRRRSGGKKRKQTGEQAAGGTPSGRQGAPVPGSAAAGRARGGGGGPSAGKKASGQGAASAPAAATPVQKEPADAPGANPAPSASSSEHGLSQPAAWQLDNAPPEPAAGNREGGHADPPQFTDGPVGGLMATDAPPGVDFLYQLGVQLRTNPELQRSLLQFLDATGTPGSQPTLAPQFSLGGSQVNGSHTQGQAGLGH